MRADLIEALRTTINVSVAKNPENADKKNLEMWRKLRDIADGTA